MEIFELKYVDEDGEHIVQARKRDSMYYVMLPKRESSKRGFFKEIAATDGETWQFYSRNPEDEPEYFLKVCLREDGTVQYDSDSTNGIVTVNDKFNPRLSNTNFPYDVAAILYRLKEQFNEILQLQQQLKDARRELLEFRLRRLGYEDVQDIRDDKTLKYALSILRDCPAYTDIYAILEDLETYEDYIEVEGFSRREYPDERKMTEVDIVYSVPSEEAKAKVIELIQRIKEITATQEMNLDDRVNMLMTRKTGFIEGYGTRKPKEFGMTYSGIMSRSEKDWDRYSEYVIAQVQAYLNGKEIDNNEPEKEKTVYNSISIWKRYSQALSLIAKIYLGLNKDLLGESASQTVDDLTGIYGKESEEYRAGEELRMLLGKIVNVDELISSAAYSENIAVCIMNLDFLKMFDEIVARDQEAMTGGLSDSIQELKADSVSILKERLEHIMFHKEAQRLEKEGGTGNWPGIPKNNNIGNGRGNYDNSDDWGNR